MPDDRNRRKVNSQDRRSTSLETRRPAPAIRRGRPTKKGPTDLTLRESYAIAQRRKDENWEKGITRVRHGVDRPMLVIIILLITLGTIMVFSASYPDALSSKGDSTFYIVKQVSFVALGTGAMIVAILLPYQAFKRAEFPIAMLAIALLVLIFFMGTARGVARRWIAVGPITIQPSEIAKLAVTLSLAKYFSNHQKEVQLGKSLKDNIIKPACILGLFAGLVLLEKHLSGTVIIVCIGLAIIYLAGVRVKQMLVFIPAGIAVIGVYLMTNSYALQRILTHGDENADVLGEAWQTTQGLYAIGNGGFLGVGLGKSALKHNYVSEAQNDFIFTIWCEEMGFVGAILLIALYGLFVWRGMHIAKHAPDTFSSLVAFGITFQVGLQALLNILVVTDVIPNTGISLPFFSYGGTSLMMLMFEMGILLSISKHSFQKKLQ